MYLVIIGFSLVAIAAWLVSALARHLNQGSTDPKQPYQLAALGAMTLVLVCFVVFFGDRFNDWVQYPYTVNNSGKRPFDPNAGYFFALQTLTTVGYGGPLPGCDQSADSSDSLATFRHLSVWAMIFGPPIFGVWVTLLYLVGIKPITKESV